MLYLVLINNITHWVMEWQFLKTEMTRIFFMEVICITSSSIPNICSTFFLSNKEDSTKTILREMGCYLRVI